MPGVSVILTVYNEADRVRTALDSVLSQNLRDFEVVVVDDGSTDGTVEVVRALEDSRIRLFEAGRLGRGGALNLAVKEARGEYLANLDADDQARADRLERQAVFLDANPEVAWLGSAEEMIDERRGERYMRRYPEENVAIRKQSAKCIPYSHSAIMFRRSLLDEGLNYDPGQPYLIDFEFFLRVAARHKVANLPDPLVRRHVRSASYFQSSFSTVRQNRHLARLCARAVRIFSLPSIYYVYPGARLVYPFLPRWIKRCIRTAQGLKEAHVTTEN